MDGISSPRQKAPPRWQRGVCRLKAFTWGQKLSNWEQTVSERDETVTGEGVAPGRWPAPRPRAQSIAGPSGPSGLFRPPQTSCDWHKRPRRITCAAALTQRLFRADTVRTQPTVKCEGEEETERQISVRSEGEDRGEGGRLHHCRPIWGQSKSWNQRDCSNCCICSYISFLLRWSTNRKLFQRLNSFKQNPNKCTFSSFDKVNQTRVWNICWWSWSWCMWGFPVLVLRISSTLITDSLWNLSQKMFQLVSPAFNPFISGSWRTLSCQSCLCGSSSAACSTAAGFGVWDEKQLYHQQSWMVIVRFTKTHSSQWFTLGAQTKA